MTAASTPLPTSRDERWLFRCIVLILLLCCAFLISKRLVDPDLWGHIQYGEDWLAEGSLPMTASHSYSAPGYRWVNHENLSELALALGHRAVGGPGLMIAKCVLGIFMLLTMIHVARRKGAVIVLATFCMLPVSAGLAEFWCARPQLASFICMAGMLLIFEASFSRWHVDGSVRFSRLVLVLPLMVVWTNSHGGFVAGFCVFTAYVGIRLLESLYRKAGIALSTKLGATIVLCGVVTLLNPYGFGLIEWLLKSLGQSRPEISEWVSIPNSGTTIVPYAVLVVLTLICWFFTGKRRDLAQFITFALVAVQAFVNCRHIAFMAILFGFWMPQHLQTVWEKIQSARSKKSEPEPMSRVGAWLVGTQIAAICAVLSSFLVYEFANFGVDRDEFPVDAVRFMSNNELNGKIVVTFNWAQYTLAALPDSMVSFDGRFRTCYPQEVVDMNFDLTIGECAGRRHRSEQSGSIDPTRVLEFGKPDFVLINRKKDRPAVSVMQAQSNWSLLYQDGMTQLWGRASKYDDPASPDYLSARSIGEDAPTGIATWPGFPKRSGRDAFVVRKQDSARVVTSTDR